MIFSEKDGVCILEGMISVSAAVKYKSRKVHLCYIDAEKVKKRDRKVLAFLKLLEQENIPTELCERAVIDAFLEKHEDAGTSHGGIAAVCGERIFTPLSELLSKTAENGGFVAVLDGVEDPFNFGYSVRNLYAAGACGIIVPQRNWMSAAGVCARSSAGATEMCHIATMPEMKDAKDHADFMKMLKKAGFFTVCAAKTAECTELFDFEPCFPAVLFVGGEKRGISPDFVANCDDIVSIPYFSDAKFSLPTASTCAIIGFEFGKRLSKDKKV